MWKDYKDFNFETNISLVVTEVSWRYLCKISNILIIPQAKTKGQTITGCKRNDFNWIISSGKTVCWKKWKYTVDKMFKEETCFFNHLIMPNQHLLNTKNAFFYALNINMEKYDLSNKGACTYYTINFGPILDPPPPPASSTSSWLWTPHPP